MVVYTPRPHQTECLDSIDTELTNADRTHVIMPCGSGKTLIQPWLVDRLNSRLAVREILVLVPTLELVRQTLMQWQSVTPAGTRYLCVCSDKSVSASEHDDAPAPDCGVTTNNKLIRSFLSEDIGDTRRVIFSTYHSVETVRRGMPARYRFDLALFDEAHRTAGDREKAFAQALTNRGIRIGKRVFVTATPRIFDQSNASTGSAPVYSMDDARIYGRAAYRLSHPEAVSKGIVVPYEVIVPSVLEEVDDNQVASISSTIAARLIALRRAMDENGVNKAFSYHNSIADARHYGELANKNKLLGDIRIMHIDSTMSARERAEVLAEYSAAPRAILTNVRYLTEGVDVPEVEMVAFMSARRSPIDVIQIVGRALRASPAKSCAYVFIPVVVSRPKADKDLHKEMREYGYTTVLQTLQTLMEGDPDFAERMKKNGGAIRERKEAAILVGGAIKFVSDDLPIEYLEKVIIPVCLDRVTLDWDGMYERFRDFVLLHQSTVFHPTTLQEQEVADWSMRQAQNAKEGLLTTRQIQLLEALEFEWDVRERRFLGNAAWYAYHIGRHGHDHFADTIPGAESGRKWIKSQRKQLSDGRLSPSRAAILKNIGFIETQWASNQAWKTALLEERFHHAGIAKIDPVVEPAMARVAEELRREMLRYGVAPGLVERLRRIGIRPPTMQSKYRELTVKRYDTLALFQ